MEKTEWRTVSLPDELVDEINKIKPGYMSVAEFVRLSVRCYLDFLSPSMNPVPRQEALIRE